MKHLETPQPPDGFWDELSARVHRAVAAEPPPSRWRWPVAPVRLGVWQPALALTVAVLLAVVATVLVMRHIRPAATAPRTTTASAPLTSPAPATVPLAGTTTVAEGTALTTGDPLDLMAALSAGLDWDQTSAAGLRVSPASADAAVASLSDDQRAELVRLLQQQLQP